MINEFLWLTFTMSSYRRESSHSFNRDVHQSNGSYEQQHTYSTPPNGQRRIELAINPESNPILGQAQSTASGAEQLHGFTSSDREPPSPTDRDSPRLDVDEESSQPRFYGPSSQRYIHDRNARRDADLDGPAGDANAELSIDSGPVRAVLLQTFWKAQPLSQAIIDQVSINCTKLNRDGRASVLIAMTDDIRNG